MKGLPTMEVVRNRVTRNPSIDTVLTYFQHSRLRNDDVFVASYPRSGSTWFRFMLYSLLTGDESSFADVDRSIAGVGHHRSAPSLLTKGGRVLQTHEPYRGEYRKAIYIARDVRDVILSQYRYDRNYGYFDGDFESYFGEFLNGRVSRYGFWGDHVNSWLDAESVGVPVLLIRFEDLKADPAARMFETMQFLGEYRALSICEAVAASHTILHMRKKEEVSQISNGRSDNQGFIGKGSTGGWQTHLDTVKLRRLLEVGSPALQRLGYLAQ